MRAAAIAVCMTAIAEEGIAPIASGTGGVMREAENRAVAMAAAVPQKEKVPEIAPAAAPKAVEKPAEKATVLGPITIINFFGSREFAVQHDLQSRLLQEDCLGGGEPRTDVDVKNALAKIQGELVKEGYFLCKLSQTRKNPYDAATAALNVLVEEGRFGALNLKFVNREYVKALERSDEQGESGAETNAAEKVELSPYLEDGEWYSRDQILARFDKIQEGETFDYKKLRRALQRINAHPDLKLNTDIDVRMPLSIEGEGDDRRAVRYADIDLTVEDERMPLHGVWEVNNYGMEEIEEWQTSATLQWLNLTRHDDVFTISPSISFNGELMSFAASYLIPHHWWLGGNTTIYGGYSRLDTDNVLPQLDLEGTGWFTGLVHTENLIDTDDHLWALQTGILMRYIDDQYSVLGYDLDKRDITVLPLSCALSYTRQRNDWLNGRNFATLQALFNVATAGDDIEEMWDNADEHYWILRWQLARLQALSFKSDNWYLPTIDTAPDDKDLQGQWTLFMKLEGQYTSDVLIPTEKLALGGHNTVRGYHSRGYLGDYGTYGTFELRTPLLIDGFARFMPYERFFDRPLERFQALVFTDYGYTCYNDLPSSYDDDEWLWSFGIGFRLALTKHCSAKCDLAFPIHDGNNDKDDDMEVYLSIQFQF